MIRLGSDTQALEVALGLKQSELLTAEYHQTAQQSADSTVPAQR